MRLIDFVDRGALRSREAECFVDGNVRYTFGEAVDLSNRIARALARDGLLPGDRVAILSSNCALGFICILGLLRADAVLVALNTRNALGDNVHHARESDASWLFFHGDATTQALEIAQSVTGLRHLIPIDRDEAGRDRMLHWLGAVTSEEVVPALPAPPDGLWRLSMTGGTTGRPKLVEQCHRSAELTVATMLALFHYETRPRYLLAAPMTHAAGMFAFAYLAMGGCVVILRKIDAAEVLDAIVSQGVNALFMPPAALYALLAHPRVKEVDYRRLKHFLVGASPVSTEKLLEAMDVFGPVMAQGFGQTEASSLLAYMGPEDYQAAREDSSLSGRLKSCGRATPFVRLAVMDAEGRLLPAGEAGEVVVRTGMLMRGYRGEPEEALRVGAHGWHHTGDIGTIDDEGFVTLLDRKRDLIITGGFNVFPSEVEQVLWRHPAVEDCAVIGVPDDKWGEAVKAVVQLKAGLKVDPVELQSWCRLQLGGVKAPKSIEIWESLPRSAVGKVLRREIRKKYWTAETRQI